MYRPSSDFKPHIPVSYKQLQEIMDRPVLVTDSLASPVMLEEFELSRRGGDWFLTVRAGDGTTGRAPCTERAGYMYPLLRRQILPHMLGRDARELEKIFADMYVADGNYKLQGLAYWCCVAWAESAVLDLLGKCAGVPVSALLGGRVRDELQLYLASGNRHTTPEEEVAILEEKAAAIGAKAVKFKLGGRMSRNADSLEGRTEGLLRLARKRLGDDIAIHTDGNGSFDAEKGVEVGRIVEEIDAYFYEEPCPFDDLWGTKAVADALDVPIAFGEQETSLRRFAWIIENDAAQVLQPDLQYTGGFLRCIQVARMAEAAGKPVTPHVSGGWASYNMLLYCAVIPNAGRYHEYKGYRGAGDCVEGGLTAKGGVIRVPDGIGLGLDLSFVDKAETVFTLRREK